MSGIARIQTSGDVQRKYLATAVDISDTATEDFLVIGYRITDSAIEFNPETETGTDINGRNFGSVDGFEPTQTFEPHSLTSGELGAIGEKLIHCFRYREFQKLSQFKCLIIYGMLGPEGGPYPADKYNACTITPQNIGGDRWTNLPFQVIFGGDVTHGTVSSLINKTVFTPTVPGG